MKEIPPKDHHLQIPHDAGDKSAILQKGDCISAQTEKVPTQKEVAFFEKQIMAIHHRMISKGYLPSLDAIRRAAEEIDGMFAFSQFSADIPEFLKARSPKYGERRVLAVEEVFCEMGLVTREELQQNPDDINTATTEHVPQEPIYTPQIEAATYPTPSYAAGDRVKVAAHSKPGHVRIPSYLLGKIGEIVHFQGMFLNPEDVAHFKETVIRLPLYLVEFDLDTVWGEACLQRCKGDKMRVEIYEPWLTWQT
jgi:nitrile hydratase